MRGYVAADDPVWTIDGYGREMKFRKVEGYGAILYGSKIAVEWGDFYRRRWEDREHRRRDFTASKWGKND